MDVPALFKLAKKFGIEVFGFYYSSYPAWVVDNQDPDRRGRLRLTVPSIIQRDSKVSWATPKGQYYGTQVIPKEGDMVWVSFLNGQLRSPIWEYYSPLTGQKPEEFKTENYYAFKSPKGHSVIINDDDDIITVTHRDGNYLSIDKGKVIVKADSILLTDADPKSPLPLGDKLDEDIALIHKVISDIKDSLTLFVTAQTTAISSSPPLAPLAPGYTKLNTDLTKLIKDLSTIKSHTDSGYHLSEKSKTN